MEKKSVLSTSKATPTLLLPHLYIAVFRQKFPVNKHPNKAMQELEIWTLSTKEISGRFVPGN